MKSSIKFDNVSPVPVLLSFIFIWSFLKALCVCVNSIHAQKKKKQLMEDQSAQ